MARPSDAGVEAGAQGVDVVDHEPAEAGAFLEQAGEDAVSEQVGHLVEVAGRVEALDGDVVGVVGTFAGGRGPIRGWLCGRRRALFACFRRAVRGAFLPRGTARLRLMGTRRWAMDWPGERWTGPSWP